MNQAAADALYAEGRALLKTGQRAAGCAKFEASEALSPAASTMINIARCHEQDGKLATAWSDYTRALTLSADTDGKERRGELEALARAGMVALTPRLPKLRVVLPRPPPGLTVWSDGRELPKGALGVALPVDPGRHEVRATAPGYREVRREVNLQEAQSADIALELERSPDALERSPEAGPTRDAPSAEEPRAGWSQPVGIALGVVGAAGIALGAVSGGVSIAKVAAIRDHCGGTQCPLGDDASLDALHVAQALGDTSTASFIVGGVLAATGVTLVLLHPEGPRQPDGGPRAASPWSARFAVGLGQLRVEGRF